MPTQRNALKPLGHALPTPREFVLDTFQLLVFMVGSEKAVQLWKEVLGKRRGRHRGSVQPNKDKELLALYYRLVVLPGRPKSLPRWIGHWVDKHRPGDYGASADAITKKLRRLLKQRNEAAAQRLELVRALAETC